jgi:hypothetical protein
MAEQLELEDFDTAKAVFEKLKDVPAERRTRILTWVAEGLGIFLQAPPPAATAPTSASTVPATVQAPATHPPPSSVSDIKTFVASKAPKSDVQFAASVAYYYRFEAPPANRRETINGEALQEAARLAGRTRLSNPAQTLRNAKNLGYLDGGSPGEFAINSVGENLVAMTLPGNAEPGAKGKRSKRAKKTKKNGRKR